MVSFQYLETAFVSGMSITRVFALTCDRLPSRAIHGKGFEGTQQVSVDPGPVTAFLAQRAAVYQAKRIEAPRSRVRIFRSRANTQADGAVHAQEMRRWSTTPNARRPNRGTW